ncbi:MAG: class I SAM-dependent methyltransferase [Cyclobacteriaceae bacterium]
MNKSSIEEIRERFDHDVDRFSNLNTGQVTTIDADISLELITESAKRIKPDATDLLDIGCGAGNYTLKMLTKIPDLNCTLVDLSMPMLDKAYERVSRETTANVNIIQSDIRIVDFFGKQFDIILAGAVLHHLREDADWHFVFSKLYAALKPGGCLMISDLIVQDSTIVNTYIWEKYGDYLNQLGGEKFSKNVFDYIEKEDSPRSLNFQMDLMKKVGFSNVEILHKNVCFAAFGGIK